MQKSSEARFQFGERSDLGGVRQNNEDSILVLQRTATFESFEHTRAVCAVADGVGGAQKGEVASRLTLETIESKASHILLEPKTEDLGASLKEAIEEANEIVLKQGMKNRKSEGMTTTIVAAVADGETGYVAHAGDSRAYLVGERGITRLTTDHSQVQEWVDAGSLSAEQARHHPKRNIITRAVGAASDIEASLSKFNLRTGDKLLLCTDGLWEPVSDNEMQTIIMRSPDPQSACDRLVSLANERGGRDNVSVALMESKSPLTTQTTPHRRDRDQGLRKVEIAAILLSLATIVASSFLLFGVVVIGTVETAIETGLNGLARSPFWIVFAIILAGLICFVAVLSRDFISSLRAAHPLPGICRPQELARRVCAKCGALARIESRFCKKCGNPL